MRHIAAIALLAASLALTPPTAAKAGSATGTTAARESLQTAATKSPVTKSIWNGYRRYNATCNHCHGPDGVGSSFGPSLVQSPLPPTAFEDIVLNGKATGESVMKGFGNDPNVIDHIDDIYAYLLARADGRLGRGRPQRPD